MKPKTIPFIDRYGHIIQVPANWTIKRAMKAGFHSFRLLPAGTPLKKNEWRNL